MELSEILGGSGVSAAGTFTTTVTDDWLQGRSVFGGLQATIALAAMRSLVPAAMPLRSLQVTFVAPVPSGAVTARASILRAGKNVTHVEARIAGSDGATQCLVVGIFGASRASAVIKRPVQPSFTSSDEPIELRYMPGLTPAFMQHMKMRWLRGPLPFTGASVADSIVEVGLLEAGPASELVLPILADAIPPLALAMLSAPSFGSSMIWMLELLDEGWERHGVQGWRVDADVTAARDGYTSQNVMLWAPDGSPAMLSRQNMVVFG
ncbi:MAG: acyl-CoA thioesterase [Labilithrix sp.]|nr:acyl-CoA thioesterase [Labilithrix sp.]